ncbi:MAG: cyclic pyranopterin monophosphate synthase MoaC [Solirubrobacteraceae bacterium]
MTVRVRLFAILRERAGRESLELELADGATVGDALEALARDPSLGDLLTRMPLGTAVNREYAGLDTRLGASDELALIPPLSGGAQVGVRVTEEPLSVDALTRAVGHPDAGAIVCFQGTTRSVERLDYEAYREMAEGRIAAILAECVQRHGLRAAAVEHRIGSVPRGQASVVVAVSAAHRSEAFAGAREAIDRIKAEAPIWKREVEAGDAGRWVDGTPAPQGRLTHLGEDGAVRMVDVGEKEVTSRKARAQVRLRMSPASASAIRQGQAPKGDVLTTARLAGIQAAKQTGLLIPLAHPLELSFIDVGASVDVEEGIVELTSEVHTTARTGVEMEAMTACAVAALTVYDMVKGLERGVEIEQIVLLEKSGGRSKDWRRSETATGG